MKSTSLRSYRYWWLCINCLFDWNTKMFSKPRSGAKIIRTDFGKSLREIISSFHADHVMFMFINLITTVSVGARSQEDLRNERSPHWVVHKPIYKIWAMTALDVRHPQLVHKPTYKIWRLNSTDVRVPQSVVHQSICKN